MEEELVRSFLKGHYDRQSVHIQQQNRHRKKRMSHSFSALFFLFSLHSPPQIKISLRRKNTLNTLFLGQLGHF